MASILEKQMGDEQIMAEAQEMLQEIMDELPQAALGKCPRCHCLSPLSSFQVPVTRKQKSSHKYLDMNSLGKLSDSEIERHIRNLRSCVSRAKDDNRISLKAKLQALLDIKAERIREST